MIPRSKSSSDENDITKRVAGKTVKGKELIIDQDPRGYFFIKFSSGGKLPKGLGGRYTRYEIAQNAVESYLVEK